jgi:ABC-2 type transport system ATP-binding protein
MSILEISNITKRYDDKLAVDNVSFKIEKGEVFGLLGPNGAGKSTLISMICGLIKADKGNVSIDGHLIEKEAVKAKSYIGLVPQEIALYENLSAIDNLKFWGSMYGLKGQILKERMEEILDATGLKDRAKENVSKYSGGMKRRLNIAAAIMHRPEILIMDEPTVGIDPQSRNHILEFTLGLNEKYKTTIIYTSHYMEEVEHLCSRVAILDEGKIIAQGSKSEIKRLVTDEETIEFKVENFKEDVMLTIKALKGIKNTRFESNILSVVVKNSQTSIQNIIEILLASKVLIKGVDIKSPDLETVFLSLTGKKLRD